MNKIFILDSQLNLTQIIQTPSFYDVIMKVSLSHIQGFKEKMTWLGMRSYADVSISSRCLTIGGILYVYETGYSQHVYNPAEYKTLSSETIDRTCLQLHVT